MNRHNEVNEGNGVSGRFSHLLRERAMVVKSLWLVMILGAHFVIAGVASGSLLPTIQAGVFDPLIIPADIANGDGVRDLRNGYQKGSVRCWSVDKQVTISWMAGGLVNSAKPPGFVPPLVEPDPFPLSTVDQPFAVRFHPNAVTRVGSGALLVAGVTRGQEVVLELWGLTYPSPMASPYTDATTGITTVSPSIPTRSSVEELHRSPASSTDYVRAMCALRKTTGVPGKAIVLFDSHGDLKELDLVSGNLVLIASSTVAGSLPAIAELGTQRYNRIVPAVRQVEGTVYRLYQKGLRGVKPSWPILVLVDADSDGDLDGHIVLDKGAWLAGGWGDSSTYVDLWLD